MGDQCLNAKFMNQINDPNEVTTNFENQERRVDMKQELFEVFGWIMVVFNTGIDT